MKHSLNSTKLLQKLRTKISENIYLNKMKIINLSLFLFLSIVNADRRIYGGKADSDNFFGHHVYLSILTNEREGFCGASAIDKNWIITVKF